jgi:nifR3 family TIM-barrel protein
MKGDFWKKLKKPIMLIAPMSGVTDEAFRLMFLKHGSPDVFWTEFVAADGLFSKGKDYCLKILEHSPKEKPIVAQIFGSDPSNIEKATLLVKDLGFDGVDLNMGCPDKNIEKQGAGAALIKNPEAAINVIRAAKKVGIPVSVKTRIGYDKNQIQGWLPVILKENISALIVHFRTKKDLYFAPAKWELAKEVVDLRDKYAPETLIIGNGDVKSLDEAKKLAEETGLDGIMVGRAVVGNPWFFSGKTTTLLERLKVIIEHAKNFTGLHKKEMNKNGQFKQFESIKKHFHAYTKNFRGAKELRDSLMKVKKFEQVNELVKKFIDETYKNRH